VKAVRKKKAKSVARALQILICGQGISSGSRSVPAVFSHWFAGQGPVRKKPFADKPFGYFWAQKYQATAADIGCTSTQRYLRSSNFGSLQTTEIKLIKNNHHA